MVFMLLIYGVYLLLCFEMIMLDEINRNLLKLLQADARLSYAELAKQVGLTPPSVAERLRKLEDAGIITGYRVAVDLTPLGFDLIAFVQIESRDRVEEAKLLENINTLPEVLESYRITGRDCVLLKVMARSMKHLDEIMIELSAYGRTTTSLVLSSNVKPTVDVFEILAQQNA